MTDLACPLVRRFARLAARDGTAGTLLSPAGEIVRTRTDILRGAHEVAERLHGVSPGTTAILSLPNSPALVEALIGLRLCKTRIALVDATATPEELRRAARTVGAGIIVAPPERMASLPLLWDAEGIAAASWTTRDPVRLPRGTAFLKMTSGSTGAPQAVALTARQVAADAVQILRTMTVRPDDATLAAIPLTHSYGFGSCLVPMLLVGLPLVFPASSLPGDLVDALAGAGVAHFPAVPAMIRALAALQRAPALPRLRVCLAAGAPLRLDDAAAFRARFGVPVHVFYGASECGGIAYDRSDAPRSHQGDVGAPMHRVRIEILDDDGASLPPGRDGRVSVASPSVAAGLVPEPEADPPIRRGVFLTSDTGRLDAAGRLTLTGRLTSLLNVAGKKVHPDEVRQVIEAMPEVRAAAVVGLPDQHRGDLIAAVVAADPALALSVQAVLTHCRSRLAPHKVPRRIVIVPELPFSERGKVQREALLELVAGGRGEVETLAPERPGKPGAPAAGS